MQLGEDMGHAWNGVVDLLLKQRGVIETVGGRQL